MISSAASASSQLPAVPVQTPVSMPDSSAKASAPVETVGAAPPVKPETSQVAVPEPVEPTPAPVVAAESAEILVDVPAPAPRASAGPLSGSALWVAAQKTLIEERPLFETWLVAAQFISHKGSQFMIGFATEQRFFRESLSRYEKEMAETISSLAGGPIELVVEVRDDLDSAEVIVEAEEPIEEVPPATAPEPEPEVPAAASAPEPKDSEEDLKKDPLISEALDVFQARVIKS